MTPWTSQMEEELTLLLKDWLKNQGRTQADLRIGLNAVSSRMPALLEVLAREYSKGGLPKIAARLCQVEKDWKENKKNDQKTEASDQKTNLDPFGQLDLLLEEMRINSNK